MDFEKQLQQLKILAGIYKPYAPRKLSKKTYLILELKSLNYKRSIIYNGTDEWFRLWFAKPHLTGEKPIGDKK